MGVTCMLPEVWTEPSRPQLSPSNLRIDTGTFTYLTNTRTDAKKVMRLDVNALNEICELKQKRLENSTSKAFGGLNQTE